MPDIKNFKINKFRDRAFFKNLQKIDSRVLDLTGLDDVDDNGDSVVDYSVEFKDGERLAYICCSVYPNDDPIESAKYSISEYFHEKEGILKFNNNQFDFIWNQILNKMYFVFRVPLQFNTMHFIKKVQNISDGYDSIEDFMNDFENIDLEALFNEYQIK